MADVRIVDLPVLSQADIDQTDVLPIEDVSASETKQSTAKGVVQRAVSSLIDNGVIPGAKVVDSSIDTAQIADNAVTTAKITSSAVTTDKVNDSAISTAKIAASAVTEAKIADDAVTTAKLNDGAVVTASIATTAVTTEKIADNSITSAKVADGAIGASALAASVVDSSKIADGSISSDELASNSVTNAKIAAGAVDATSIATGSVGTGALADNAVTSVKINAGAVTNAKLAASSVGNTNLIDGSIGFEKTNFAANSLPGSKLTDNSVTSGKLAADAVTGSAIADRTVSSVHIELNSITNDELASNSVESTELASNAVTTAKINASAVTTDKLADGAVSNAKVGVGIDGSKLSDDTVTAAKLTTAAMDRGLDKTSGSIGHTNAITAGTTSGITFDEQGHITETTALVAADLPAATADDLGAVSVPTDSGLTVDAAGDLTIDNTVVAGTATAVTFNEHGLITASSNLTAADLPIATATTAGAVSVGDASGLEVDASGNIFIPEQNAIANETAFTKVTVNEQGIVTNGESLAAGDIPGHSAELLTSGLLPAGRIGTQSLTGAMMADNSTAKFGGADDSGGIVSFPQADYKGQFFFDSRNEDLYIYDGNAYQPVTITSGEIIFAGTYDASTGDVVSVTSAGQASGLTAGSTLPAATADNLKYYVVVSVAGTGSAPAPTVELNPPDILLSNGSTWDKLDVSSFVASQQASNIAYTPQGSLASINVQTALTELDTEKLPKAGGTMTGELLISDTGTLVFEGATDNTAETTIGVVDPTADRTINFPDISGTVVTTGDTGTVTSTMIADGTIANGDVASNAAITFTKLENLASAHILLGNSTNVPTAAAVTGDIGINNSGVTSITAGAIVDADINASAAISGSKIVGATTSVVGAVQLNDTTTSTSIVQAATANAVRATKVVADAALPKAGGTITGTVTVSETGLLRFEGSSPDNFETSFAFVDPTADRTVTFQNASGTVALTSQLDDGTY